MKKLHTLYVEMLKSTFLLNNMMSLFMMLFAETESLCKKKKQKL